MKNDYKYSCAECAEKLGAKSDGGQHTVHIEKCELCGEEKPLWHRNDWLWPDEKRSIWQWD